ncbi:lipopolysaccharide biosynthesis protein [Microbacterium testaceum]|uniref:lipopolysaccharide biosynthesis protein n=1 Tax=Microbacterium testaceum TaxID=2033 RepID=UPI000733E6FE|nr:hypothetical protein [Microbacterium testaceum]KTS03332.1 hypothetical protein NS283_12365 [Microbacterium testaceum]
MRALLGRLVGFGSLPLLASLAPLLLLGIVTRSCTADEWAALSIGQAVGSFATAATMFGWQVVGPPAVALAAGEEGAREIYAASWWLRAGVFLTATPSAAVVAAGLSPAGNAVLAISMCASAAFAGMSMTWYAIGRGRPGMITIFEVIPRLAFLTLGAIVVALTGHAVWYPVSALVGAVGTQAVFHRRTFRWTVPRWPGRAALTGALRLSAPGAAVVVLGGVRSAAPIPAATFVSDPGTVARLSSADRLYRYSLFSVSALGDALQNWVLEAGVGGRRHHIALLLHTVLGVLGAAGLGLVGPWATAVLFGGHLGATKELFVGYAVAFFFVSLGTPLVRNVLVPLGRTRAVVVADAAGLVCGAGTAFLLVPTVGVAGIPLALATTEAAATLGYALSAVIVSRGLKNGASAMGDPGAARAD